MCLKADDETEWNCEQQTDNFLYSGMHEAFGHYVNLLKFERLNEVGFDISGDQFVDIYTAKPWYLTDLATADLLRNPVGWHEYPNVQHFIITNHDHYIQVSQRFFDAKNYSGFYSEDVFYRDVGKTTIVLPDFGLDE